MIEERKTDIVKCAVYYDSENLPVLCHDHHCANCEYDCFEAVVKIIPIDMDEVSGIKNLDRLEDAVNKTNKRFKKADQELKKTVQSLSKIMKRFK